MYESPIPAGRLLHNSNSRGPAFNARQRSWRAVMLAKGNCCSALKAGPKEEETRTWSLQRHYRGSFTDSEL